MKEKIEIKPMQHREKFDIGKFKEYFPEGEINGITFEDIPGKVMEFFEKKSEEYINIDNYKPKNFSKYFIINYKNGDVAYVAIQEKDYGKYAGTEESTYLTDMKEDDISGYSEIRYNLSKQDNEYFKDKPFIGFTRTSPEFARLGLATRRLLTMNALSQAKYNKPIYSGTLISEQAKKLWEKLVERGEAKKFKEGKHDRYVLERV